MIFLLHIALSSPRQLSFPNLSCLVGMRLSILFWVVLSSFSLVYIISAFLSTFRSMCFSSLSSPHARASSVVSPLPFRKPAPFSLSVRCVHPDLIVVCHSEHPHLVHLNPPSCLSTSTITSPNSHLSIPTSILRGISLLYSSFTPMHLICLCATILRTFLFPISQSF